MTEKSGKRGYKKKAPIEECKPLKKRGRPKGSKNKPKQPPVSEVAITPAVSKQKRPRRNVSTAAKPRGRPKKSQAPPAPAEPQLHPLILAARWLEKHLSPIEERYYKGRANRYETTLDVAMAYDILAIFNVNSQELRKQINSK